MNAGDDRNHPSWGLPVPLPGMSTRSMTNLLTQRIATGGVLQELSPIWKSLPWMRSQRYWAQAGVDVFTSGEVPYIVTNDGEQSRKALELYLASLHAAEQHGDREDTSYVLELGAGSGLFAKLFLDQLRDRSRVDGSSAYERTKYLVCDASPGLLEDTRVSGVFADHEERVERLNVPVKGVRAALAQAVGPAVGAIRAVHANYVLDSLPFTILSRRGDQLFELQVRTRLREDATHPGGARPPVDDLEAMCTWLDELGDRDTPAAHQALAYEGEYVRVERVALPHPDVVPAPQDGAPAGTSQQMVHSFGAVECLEEIVGLLRPDGYFVGMDYSYQGTSPGPIEFQCFGRSIAAGVNFAQLVQRARVLSGVVVALPDVDPVNLQARMFARQQVSAEVLERFRSLYGKAAWDAIDTPYREAVELQQSGQFEAARWKYEAAHRLQPYTWSLMEAIVAFLTYTLGEHEAGLEAAKRALQLNHLSPRLWNLLGDCYYGLDDIESAERAYQQAARVNPVDTRARTNLAYVHLKRGTPAAALRVIGEALALDRAGDYRDELLAKQAEALQALASRQAHGAFSNINRLSGHHALPGRNPT